ncbi:hypothetical protein PJV94_05895 [Aliarcobacter butzleri]|uniref:hypothetical protein n=1 Tax=Aliarcobacter butzleri TaxID=28197 RepID=UPI00263C0D53|nr:hypothetical protein [Aliarcobacter butzleri]MDN5072354.1 hypothetical protein [Aliarcobacter butzleri]MDN5121208.1 hypothetical protein [Aliarcobacter butzleri]
MRNLFIYAFIIGLFIGCGKKEPTLPESYENISFNDLMETMELKKTYSDNNSTIYESEVMDSKNYKNSNFYNYNEPMNRYCNAIGGKVNVFSVLDKLDTNYLKEQIDYSKVSTFYCKKDNAILFTFFTEQIENPSKKYSQYKYYFVNSKILSNEVSNFLNKKDRNEFIKAENEKIKLNNKIQMVQNKVKLIDTKIKSIIDNSSQNSSLINYQKNNFKDVNGIYYFSVMNRIEKWGTNKIRLNFDGFYIFKEVENLREDFTNKILNRVETNYRFKVKGYRNEDLIATSKFDIYDVFEINKDLDLSKVDVIIGFKQVNNPDIVRRCNDSKLLNAFTANPNSIKNLRGADCYQGYSYDAVLYNIIVYDHKTKQIVFYAVNE